VKFVRQHGLAVVATRGPDGAPEAALVGVAATDELEIVFDTASAPGSTATFKRTLGSRS